MEKGQESGQAAKGKCKGCGSGNHRSYDSACPAKGAECRFCHRLGHYESVCITNQKSQMASSHTGMHAGGGKSLKHIAPALHAVSASSLAETPFQMTLHLHVPNGQVHTMEGEVDMGSYCSIVSHRLFDSEFRRMPLKCLTGPCFTFGGIKIFGLEGLSRSQLWLVGRNVQQTFWFPLQT